MRPCRVAHHVLRDGNRLASVTDVAGTVVTYGYGNAISQMMGLPTSAYDANGCVTQTDVDLGKSSQQNATDLLNNKYGFGNWKKGPNTEFNKIVKWIDRGLKAVIFIMATMLTED